MKNSIRLLSFVLMIAAVLLSACGGMGAAATSTVGGGKVEPIPVVFIGLVDSIAGDQWVINGQTVTVSPEMIQDGPFSMGDQVKVEGVVSTDGSFLVSRVEAPSPQDVSTLPQFGDDDSNDSNSNDANGNDANVNDDNGNAVNSNDDNSNTANSNVDNGNGANTNDDNGNDGNSNDDNGNSVNTNDDNGNDDNGDNDNSDDDDNNSNSGGGNDNGDDDRGGNDDDDDDND